MYPSDSSTFAIATLSLEDGIFTAAFWACWPLRMRVSMSAIGSDILILLTPYQLALVIPGTSPRKAISRSLLRHRPNLRNTPRGRPVRLQRLRCRVGLALRGSCCRRSRAAIRSSSESFTSPTRASSSARLAANFATSLARFFSRLIKASFAMAASILKWELEGAEQSPGLLVSLGSRRDADVQPTQRIDLVVLDLGKDDLFLDAKVVVASTIEPLTLHAAEVANARHSDGNQTIQEFEHPRPSERHHAADGIPFANLEARDGFPSLSGHRLLAGDLGQICHSVLEDFLITDRLTDTHIQSNFGDPRSFHHRLVPETCYQVGHHGFFVELLQTSHGHSLCVHQFAVRFEEANATTIFELPEPDTITLLDRRVVQSDIGNVDRHFFLDNATHLTLEGIGTDMLLHAVDTLDDYTIIAGATQHSPFATPIFAGEHHHTIAFTNLVHRQSSENFRRQGDDLHETLGPQLAGHRPEDAGSDRLQLVVEQHGGIAVELDQGAIGPAHALGGAHHHGAVDITLLDATTRGCVLDGDLDDVADARIATLGAAEHLDTHHRTRARVVGHVQHGLHLNHEISPTYPALGGQSWTPSGDYRPTDGGAKTTKSNSLAPKRQAVSICPIRSPEPFR